MEYVFHAPPVWVFITAVLAIVPLAEWTRRATEHVAHRAGSAIGGLLNVTFGNMAELIIALFILSSGHVEVVKAQITGSVIGNSLLGLGLAATFGGFKKDRQTFPVAKAGLLSSMLMLTVIALLIPALFDITERGTPEAHRLWANDQLSTLVSIVLIVVYIANLVYTLVTHKGIFSIDDEETEAHAWPLWKSVGVLVAATAGIAFEAELVSGALEATSQQLHLTPFFLGLIVLAVVGNFAEYISAVYFARKDRMDLVMTITVGSTIQVALLTAPVLVLVSHLYRKPMNLIFSNPLEMIAIASVAFAVGAVTRDGETTWFEGILLLAVYLMLAIAFFFVR